MLSEMPSNYKKYKNNSVDEIDYTVINMFVAHMLYVRPLKKEDIRADGIYDDAVIDAIIEKYKDQEYDEEKETYEDQDKIHKTLKNIDLRALSKNPRTIVGVSPTEEFEGPINEYLEKHIKRLNLWGYDIPQDLSELYLTEYIENDCLTTVLFLEFKDLSKITADVINYDKPSYITFKNCMQWHRICLDRLNVREFTKYPRYFLDKIMEKIEKPPEFLFTAELSFVDKLKTKPYNYQLHNINLMIDYEKNQISDKYITHDNLVFFPDGRVWIYDDNRFMTEDDPETVIRGGVICDEVRVGKTLQALCLAYSTPEINTLIVVPNHLKQYWESECLKHFGEVPTFIKIITRNQYMVYRKPYDRIIFDEYHEIFIERDTEDPEMETKLYRKSIFDNVKNKWAITATPFPLDDSLFNILRFLTCQGFNYNTHHPKRDNHKSSDFDARDYINESMPQYGQIQYIWDKILLRNTHKNIVNEVKLPKIIYDNVLIDFNNFEQLTYEAEVGTNVGRDMTKENKINELRKFCCDLSLTFNEGNTQISYTTYMDNVKNFYENKLQNDIMHLEKLNKQYFFTGQNINLFHAIQNQEKIVEACKNALENFKKGIHILQACGICMSDIDVSQPFTVITSCSHMYCNECINMWTQASSKKCPSCNKPFKMNELCEMTNEMTETKKEIVKYSQYSSKIKRLLEYLETTNGKVLIYTQFDMFVNRLKDILLTNGMSSTVFKSSDDIENFKNNDDKIMFLSSLKNASGIDLSYVNNIVILEPIKSDNDRYVVEIEKQIIGRIFKVNKEEDCHVTRLIIRNTIEEEIYNKCKIFTENNK